MRNCSASIKHNQFEPEFQHRSSETHSLLELYPSLYTKDGQPKYPKSGFHNTNKIALSSKKTCDECQLAIRGQQRLRLVLWALQVSAACGFLSASDVK